MKKIAELTQFNEAAQEVRFSNGLEITASHIRLGDQTWAVNKIKRVGIRQEASWVSMLVCGLVALTLGIGTLQGIQDGAGGLMIVSLGITAFCGYQAYSFWDSFGIARVWLQTGTVPVFVFKSRDLEKAERVKKLIENVIAHHTPT